MDLTRRFGAERRSASALVANYIHELSDRHNGRERISTRTSPSTEPKETRVRIGIIGSGNIGATAARLFVDAGYDVAIANSRGPETLRGVVDDLGPRAHAAEPADAAAFGDLVLVAIPFGRCSELPAGALADTTVIDATNYFPQRDGHFPDLDADRTTSSELLAAHLSGARVVKAFNTLNWKTLRDGGKPSRGEDRLVQFLAGDDPDAKEQVARLIEDIGFAAVDAGGLADGGRRLQPGSALSGEELTVREAEDLLGTAVRPG
jgi:predicted dinucleotide-binding enzyme